MSICGCGLGFMGLRSSILRMQFLAGSGSAMTSAGAWEGSQLRKRRKPLDRELLTQAHMCTTRIFGMCQEAGSGKSPCMDTRMTDSVGDEPSICCTRPHQDYSSELTQDWSSPWHTYAPWRHVQAPRLIEHCVCRLKSNLIAFPVCLCCSDAWTHVGLRPVALHSSD